MRILALILFFSSPFLVMAQISKQTGSHVMEIFLFNYSDIFQAKLGLTLNFEKEFQFQEASIQTNRNLRAIPPLANINVYGGLLALSGMSEEVLALALCHEIGHQMGGTPKRFPQTPRNGWLAAEAQADYYATLSCFRRMASLFPESSALSEAESKEAEKLCQKSWVTENDLKTCKRSLRVAQNLMNALGKIQHEQVSILSPSHDKVDVTEVNYPSLQCRLDSMVRGALCNRTEILFIEDSYTENSVCHEEHNKRPSCWFKENS